MLVFNVFCGWKRPWTPPEVHRVCSEWMISCLAQGIRRRESSICKAACRPSFQYRSIQYEYVWVVLRLLSMYDTDRDQTPVWPAKCAKQMIVQSTGSSFKNDTYVMHLPKAHRLRHKKMTAAWVATLTQYEYVPVQGNSLQPPWLLDFDSWPVYVVYAPRFDSHNSQLPQRSFTTLSLSCHQYGAATAVAITKDGHRNGVWVKRADASVPKSKSIGITFCV